MSTECDRSTVTVLDTGPVRRVRGAWSYAHDPVPGAPRWTRRAAVAVILAVLPSSLWRIALCTLHLPIGRGDLGHGAAAGSIGSGVPGLPLEVYVVLLSVVSELVAFTAFGLIAGWGEVFPRWIPLLGRRRVPTLFAVVPAVVGATILTVVCTWTAITFSLGRRVDGSKQTDTPPVSFDDWQGVLGFLAYGPLLLWGPLLGALAVSYWRRRRHTTN